MTAIVSLRTAGRLARSLLAAAGLLAALGARGAAADQITTTKAYPVAVECAGATQRCNENFELTVHTSAVLRARFVASPMHCSDIRVGITHWFKTESGLGLPPIWTDFLAPGASSQEYVLDPPASRVGDQRIIVSAEGRDGGCNTGRLSSYSGMLYVTTSQPTPAATVPMIRQGAAGESVRTIQYLLRHHGADLVVDGDFGQQTDQRVRAFQGANGLDADGIVGPQTWPKLLVTVRRGDQGDAVRAAQGQLAARGIDVAVDGDFGEETEREVRAFQQAKGLDPDGVVGLRTWAALVAAD